MKAIILTRGRIATVDDEDFDRVNQFKWCALKKGRTYYAVRNDFSSGKRRTVYLHNFLLGTLGVDHRDGDGLNNLQENLRRATKHQNNCAFKTKRVGATSQYRGVYWNSRNENWNASLRSGGKNSHLGCFSDEAEAARAYDVAAIKLFGEFAAPNFPVSCRD